MNTITVISATTTELTIIPWSDPLIEATGHRPGSHYVEAVWLGTLGPTATWAWQRLARLATVAASTPIDVIDLAVSLGLGEGMARNSQLPRTLSRLVGFDAAHAGAGTLAVRLALPDIPHHLLPRLSASARATHDLHVRTRRSVPPTA